MNKLTNSFTFTKRSAKILAIFTLLACGPGMADYDEFMSLFMPESANASASDQKYHFTPMFFYNDNENENFFSEGNEGKEVVDLCQVENVKAWQAYCQGKVSEKDIETGIYGTFQNSKLQKFLKSTKNQAAIDYVQLAKDAEKIFITSTETYSDVAEIDSILTLDLANKALNFAIQNKTNKDEFLKERFGFQTVKLFSIAKKHEEAIENFKKLIVPIKAKTFISDWALMRKAESETALEKTAEAYYDFAQVFDRSASHRSQADLVARARIDSFEVDNEVIKLCKNDHEKAAVYAFAGVKDGLDALPLLEKMVEIDPKNQLIELIMAREINKNERFFYQQSPYGYYGQDTTLLHEGRRNSTNYWSKLKDFSAKCTDNQNLTKTGFWQTASAYMEFVQGDFAKSEQFLIQAKAINTTNKALTKQILIQELLLAAKKSKEITPEIEMAYLPILEKFAKPESFRVSNAILESCKILGAKYRGQAPQIEEKKGGWFSSCSNKDKSIGESISVPHSIAKAYLLTMLTTQQVNSNDKYGGFESQKDMFTIEDTTSLATIEKVVAYFSESKKTDFDKRLQKLVGFNNDHLYVLMGRRAMDENDFAKAAEAFGKVTPSVWKSEEWTGMFNNDPFYVSTIYSDKKPNKNYNPYTFAKKMAELSAKVKANPNDSESAYLLGCGSFNTTYYGNAWILRRHSWSSTEVNTYSYAKANYNIDYYQATKAREFFLESMKSPNQEMAAKACFGAAICERCTFETYAGTQEGAEEESYEDFNKRMAAERVKKFGTYFKILNKRFRETKYESQVLSECGDYSDFTTR
jgi:hypothetical protein